MTTLDLDQLLEAPNIKLLMQQAEIALRDEARQRQAFYEWIHEDHKAEFINGAIIMQSPAKERHWMAVGNLYRLLSAFVIKHKLGRVASEKAMISLTRNDYEPDICFWTADRSHEFEGEMMQFPAPDLIVEVLSKSTEKIDRGVKFNDYAAHSVQEYWIIDPKKQVIEQYILDKDVQAFVLENTLRIPHQIESKIVTGFQIPVQAIFDELSSNEILVSLLTN
ncbi:Uma2 family endonuclease [Spirosoma sp. HMF3257]|uniref:Uma2 family endonuclease n=1 Tax=Spirosoma telluris TaxID=2183553 RepID=A0A327NHW4_9BACT|nr:Uma2 family endonuclease [Spirosoma telluris]RAI74405.1 Uma2 family endonuclease [Spirosoma telluris]